MSGPNPNDYDGVTAWRFQMDDSPPDDMWIAQAPIAAFTAFLDHPVDWVKYLPSTSGAPPIGVTLVSPFVIDVTGLDDTTAPLYDVMIQGIDETSTITVRASLLGATRAMYEAYKALVTKGNGAGLIPLDITVDQTNYHEIYEILTPWYLKTLTLKDPAKPDGSLKDMRVYLDAGNFRAYSHLQVVDTIGYKNLAAYLTTMSINGRAKQAFIMDNINQEAFNMKDQPIASLVFQGTAATPGVSPDCFHLLYASNGLNPSNACDMITSSYYDDPVVGPYAVPETSIVKDYAV
ncbi:MAG TPA: hypothetical protein VHE55_03400 [Fimbriimonadaceae bacterium]|nr:hypothetical protein [Fimbriimonadaceae bacterium]